MAHHGEKIALGPARGLGCFFCFFQLGFVANTIGDIAIAADAANRSIIDAQRLGVTLEDPSVFECERVAAALARRQLPFDKREKLLGIA